MVKLMHIYKVDIKSTIWCERANAGIYLGIKLEPTTRSKHHDGGRAERIFCR